MTVIRFDVVVYFDRRRPSAAELMAVRHCDPSLRNHSIAQVREWVERACKDDWTWTISFINERDATAAIQELQARGIRTELR